MSGLKLYYDLMSQPARAVFMFLKSNNIPFEPKPVALRKGEHHTDEYRKISPFGLVPVIDDNGFTLTESVAILSYLSDHYKVADHWYPKNPQARARVDQYMAWQHHGIRLFGSMVFRIQARVIEPRMTNEPIDPKRLAAAKANLESVLDQMENIFLKDNTFLAGDDISIADLLGICELMQPYAVGYDISAGRPRLAAYVERVKGRLPCFSEAHIMVHKIRSMWLKPKAGL
ncbi:hypothetical protein CAPTEDRAFT_173236 [Capitella teleta]|uniref:glutathione transferase n=1 Tax=Capitella teleta TaxID=283909 RepID=R7TFY8_CAPTE|nr:hypothetical protein CAPTEDRAFT_173236 [Capitella teleta]|eukprot:ELT90456.1 hypothetical protein CAPTEDRAFT_173236 [Capitella teleta]